MKFRDKVLLRNNKLEHVPSGYKRLGNKIILRSTHNLTKKLGQIILELYPWCEGVFQHQNTIGEARTPMLIHLAGSTETIVHHFENRALYVLDIAHITFSGGNSQLRKRLANQVNNCECLLDMFAAVGNLSLQPLLKNKITAMLIEKNEVTYKYLVKTLQYNKINPDIAVNMDCRDLTIKDWADRIFMGYHNVNLSHVKAAVQAAKSEAIIHLHPLAKSKHYEQCVKHYKNYFDQCNVNSTIDMINKIKNYSPGLDHIELVFSINK